MTSMDTTTPNLISPHLLRAQPGDWLSFTLGEEVHAVPVPQVYGVLALPSVTPVPNLPPFLRGVLHHEGAIMPVMDLAQRLGMPATVVGAETCVILVRVPHAGRTLAMAVIVAEVRDVLVFERAQLLPPPEFGMRLDTRFLLGMVRGDDAGLTLLLDLECVLDEDELSAAAAAIT